MGQSKAYSIVYYVDGGMEDWSYGASWESSPKPINQCKPRSYGGYALDRTKYRKDSIGTLVYLAEMDNMKHAPVGTLGRKPQVWGNSHADGHVARNMRMCLKLMELTRPEVVITPPSLPSSLRTGDPFAVLLFG